MSLAPASLLQLIWLASPALPVGGFSYSEGLEAAVDDGRVHDEASAALWLMDQLHLSLGRSELPLVAAALDAARRDDTARLQSLAGWHARTRETSEARLQSEQMGRSLIDWLATLGASPVAAPRPCPWPIAFALAAARGEASSRDVLLAFGFSWAENQVQAALKSVPLGQSAGQRILAVLARELPAVVDAALAIGDEARQAFTPGLAIASSRHETQYSRLFRS
jgi:urease accessory protein